MFNLNMCVVLAIFFFVSVYEVACHYREAKIIRDLVGNCSGTEKEITINDSDMKYLTFIVFGANDTKQKYHYDEMDKLSRNKNIDFKRRTLLFITGYLGSPYFFVFSILGLEYMKLNYNVIGLDMNHFTTVTYSTSVRYQRVIGKKSAEMLFNLTKEGLDPKKLEIIGLSLGGQTMSYVAKEFRNLSGQKINRLTGLDPAGPCYENLEPEKKLHPSDGEFVEVIYTNIEGLGIADVAGHVNFYINGGEWQPGELWWFPCMNVCSHVRSYQLWAAALKFRDKFIGIKCDSAKQAREKDCFDRQPLETNVLGLDVDKSKHGIYYVSTSYKYPFYLGEKGLNKYYKYIRSETGSMSLIDVIKFWIR